MTEDVTQVHLNKTLQTSHGLMVVGSSLTSHVARLPHVPLRGKVNSGACFR